jgi:hypothetical protein
MKKILFLVLAFVLTYALTASTASGLEPVPVPPAIPPSAPGTIIIYGDSFLTQGQAYLSDNLTAPGWNVVIRQQAASAICNWIPTMQQDAVNVPNIRIVVMTFVGSMDPPCTQNRGTQTQVYTEDSTTVANFWKAQGVRVLWVGPPGPPGNPGSVGTDPLVPVYWNVAENLGQGYVDSGVDLETVDHLWPLSLPCEIFDYVAGQCGADGLVQIRYSAYDNHLCPVNPGFNACQVYSSGIVRWGSAIVTGVKVQENGQGAWNPAVLYPIVNLWKGMF